jgi:hypothetical protein
MTFVLVMWIVWGTLVAVTAALYLFRSGLQRDEEDQIFLDDAFSQEKQVQEAIAAKVNKLEPALRIMKLLDVLVTVFVIVFYIRDFFTQFK